MLDACKEEDLMAYFELLDQKLDEVIESAKKQKGDIKDIIDRNKVIDSDKLSESLQKLEAFIHEPFVKGEIGPNFKRYF